ncbi:MAG: hypothetical protein KC583_06985 [Myxococcales bacterium]|nr:hypothetical protein [Myxococcales bacterium]
MRHRPALSTALAAALLTTLLAAPALAESTFVGGIEGMLGFPGGYSNDGSAESTTDVVRTNIQEGDLDTSFGLVPWVEQKLGDVVGFGGEVMFVWMGADHEKERRLVLSPHLRVRMAFPIIDKVTFDAFLAGGPSIWSATDGTTNRSQVNDTDGWRFGWSLRFGFGGSYAINDSVSVYSHLGWYTTTTYGDDITANRQTVPLCVGLRGNF